MSRIRVYELAKELGIEAKDLVARLEKAGIRGKRSQSSLTEQELERARVALGVERPPTVTIGAERVVTADTGERLVERRVGAKVIRRRAAQVSEPPPEAPPSEPLTVPEEAIPTFAGPEPLAEPLEMPGLPELPPEPAVPEPTAEVPLGPEAAGAPGGTEPEEAPVAPTVEPLETTAEERETAPAATAAETEAASAAPAPERPVGPKVLGRIDLKKVEAQRAAAERASGALAGRGRRPAAQPLAEPLPAVPARGKRKKRRVIQKPEFAEIAERELRTHRLPRKRRAQPGKEQKKTEITTPKASKRVVRIVEGISVGDLAKAMGVKAAEVVKKLMESGVMATVNQVLDVDTATLIASEFGYTVENVAFDVESAIEVGHEPTEEEHLEPRPPVVTVMGHVDHGKTSLLDVIRKTNVAATEAGGITQHIGAYTVTVDGRQVTFIDTPGHEAFTAMRARGAKVTDIVILVVAADDGVMPQTVEAINHARAAGVPIVVAINKIDKPEANIERIKQELAEHGLVPEDWGGETICVPVSARTQQGIPDLLEMLFLQAELLDLKANREKPARGTIIEAKLERGRGPVATVLVQEGTLKLGDPFVCGTAAGRVRAMMDDRGRRVTEAGPSTPVEILGLPSVPEAGSQFVVVADEAVAKQVAEHRQQKQREATLLKTAKVSLEDLYRRVQAGDTKTLRVIIKADTQGSAEALADALTRLSTDEVRLEVLHASVGGITESDIMLASASDAVVIGHNVRPEAKATQAAEREGVDVKLYTVIYDALNDVRDAMEGMLEPTFRERLLGRAEVRQTFTVPGAGTVAGCLVSEGKMTRNARARLVRDHVVVYEGKIASLRRFKEDVREVAAGYECGIGLENFQDIKVGDTIEAYEMEQVTRRLGSAAPARSATADRPF